MLHVSMMWEFYVWTTGYEMAVKRSVETALNPQASDHLERFWFFMMELYLLVWGQLK